MSVQIYNWLHAGHIIGFVLWIGGLITVLQLLRVHGAIEGAVRDVLSRSERKAAVLMDLGATLAIVCGLWMAFDPPSRVNAFKTGGWLHVKLAIIVLGILSIHGFSRARIRQFRRGKVRPIPRALTYIVLVAAAAAIVLGANVDILRK